MVSMFFSQESRIPGSSAGENARARPARTASPATKTFAERSGERTEVPIFIEALRRDQFVPDEPLALLAKDDARGVVNDAVPGVQDPVPEERSGDCYDNRTTETRRHGGGHGSCWSRFSASVRLLRVS